LFDRVVHSLFCTTIDDSRFFTRQTPGKLPIRYRLSSPSQGLFHFPVHGSSLFQRENGEKRSVVVATRLEFGKLSAISSIMISSDD